jgi:hypothetical protein
MFGYFAQGAGVPTSGVRREQLPESGAIGVDHGLSISTLGHLEQHPFFSPWAPAEFQIELG